LLKIHPVPFQGAGFIGPPPGPEATDHVVGIQGRIPAEAGDDGLPLRDGEGIHIGEPWGQAKVLCGFGECPNTFHSPSHIPLVHTYLSDNAV